MTRLDLARDALAGLSVGDALGAQYFVPGNALPRIPAGRWEWTDDTEMACSVFTELRDRGEIDQDELAALFADRCEPYRGYGPGAVVILHRIRDGVPWQTAAGAAFGGTGSCGNGGAMRIAPLGAFFADDPDQVVEQATRACQVTHLHPEGVAGGVAVALAAAYTGGCRLAKASPTADGLFDFVLARLPDSEVRRRVERARQLLGRSAAEVAFELGNGSRVLAQDTVPFTTWVAATHSDDYRQAVLTCVEVGGDIDTTGAIVGGIVSLVAEVPADWLASREPLPDWVT